MIIASVTACLVYDRPARAEDLVARSLRASALPQLRLGAALTRGPRGLGAEVYALLRWPLDRPAKKLHAELAPDGSGRVARRLATLRARISALRANASDAERRLDLEEAEAELNALLPEEAP